MKVIFSYVLDKVFVLSLFNILSFLFSIYVHFGRTRYEMHIRINLHYESDCILSACVYAYDRIAAHTHIHIQMLIEGRLSIAIRLLIHFLFQFIQHDCQLSSTTAATHHHICHILISNNTC
jgi:hypothetical protein